MYQFRLPDHPQLREYIEVYWFLTATSTKHISEYIVVDGQADILINFGIPYQRMNTHTGITETITISNIDAQRTYPIQIQTNGQINLLGIRFRRGALYPFIGMPLHELTDLTINLPTIYGQEGVDLEDQLSQHITNPNAQRDILDSFFVKKLNLSQSFQMVSHLSSQLPYKSIKDLSEHIGYSERSVHRLFQNNIGFSPKFYTRLLRFQSALTLVIDHPQRSLADISQSCGYYDQAHFSKDFRHFYGQSPSDVRETLHPTP